MEKDDGTFAQSDRGEGQLAKVTITEHDLGARIDKLLSIHFPDYSRTYFQQLIESEAVLLNGHPIKKRYTPEKGDEIVVHFSPLPPLDVSPEDIPLEILYEDEHMIAINKPAGMVVHPAPGAPTGTFANALLHHCNNIDRAEFDPLRPGIVHRLDKDTSGVLLGAKTRQAHQKLTEQFSQREVEKTYLAICCGVPKEGLFSAPIKRHPIRRKEMAISSEGKEAISHFTILRRKEGLSLIEVGLITGRTHQIRVHLKAQNCPVLGDPLYGSISLNNKYRVEGQLLHAHKMVLTHPISEVPLELIAPIPPSMKNFIDLISHP